MVIGKEHIREKALFFTFLILIPYLLFNVGFFSDDFSDMAGLKNRSLLHIIFPINSPFLSIPVAHYTTYIWYYFCEIDNYLVVSIVKIIYSLLSFYLISRFFSIFLKPFNALMVSAIFLLFPSHDSTVYFLQNYYLTLSIAFYLYSYYLAHRNKLKLAFIFAILGSFISYGSFPVALALFILFLLHKEYKKGAIIFIPDIIYSCYYIVVTTIMGLGTPRVLETSSLIDLIKQFILQIATFCDAVFGPSIWLKIYFAFFQLSVPSLIIGVVVTIIFYKTYEDIYDRYNPKLLKSFVVLTIGAFVIFAVTGRYPQLAFNLGNRTTIFGSLLISYLLILIPVNKKWKTLAFAVFIFTVLGISDHWKNCDFQQQQVIKNIINNEDLKDYTAKRVIYVSGNQYSKYGPISHIEFLSETWVPQSIFNLAFKKDIYAVTINKRHVYEDGYLIDTKYNTKAEVNDYINVYDSGNDRLLTLNVEEINSYIDSLPPENRHWIMLSDNRLIRFARTLVLKLMPRLEYAL